MKKKLKNSKNKQKDLSTIVVILVVVVVGMSIAYAALSSTLTIQMNQVTQNSLSWNVGFQPGTVTGTPGGSSSSTGRSCGNATVTANSVTVADLDNVLNADVLLSTLSSIKIYTSFSSTSFTILSTSNFKSVSFITTSLFVPKKFTELYNPSNVFKSSFVILK